MGAEPGAGGTLAAPAGTLPPAVARVVALVRRVPFTASVVALMLVLAVATGALWNPLSEQGLFDQVAYGLPAFEAGRWWTLVSGSLFALNPAEYLPVAGGFALLVGFAEWRMGTRRAAFATLSGQAVGIVGAALVVRLLVPTGWTWALRVSDDLDVGFSAGALAAVAVASAGITAPWRGRLRVLLLAYTVGSLLYVGVLWDLEHALAVVYGLAVGPRVVGRPYRWGRIRVTRHEWRILAASAFAFSALVEVVVYFVPADGPLGASTTDDSATSALIGAAIWLLLANGLRRGRRAAWRWALGLSLFLLVFLVLAGVLWLLGADDVDVVVAGSLPADVLTVLLWVGQTFVLILGRSAFHSPGRRALVRKGLVGTDDRTQAVGLLKQHGGTSLSWMTTWDGNRWFFPPGHRGAPLGYQAFQVHSRTSIGLGDPVAETAQDRAVILDSFVDLGDSNGVLTCLFSVTDETVTWAGQRGWQSLRVAEEAVVDLPDLEMKGKAWQDVRTALNRAAKEGVEFRVDRLGAMPRGVLIQVRAISEMWVSDKGLPEMAFTLGGVDEALDPDVRVGLAIDGDGTVHGVTSWLPVHAPGGEVVAWTLDVMRRLPDGFRPVTEFLIASACLTFKEEGCAYVSLSGAPLAHEDEREDARTLERLLDGVGAALEPMYGFQSLEAFKAKFQPRHQTLWLAYKDEAQLPRIGLALTRAYLPDASLRELAVAGIQSGRG